MSVDPAWKGVYKAGGVSAVIMGILVILGILLMFAQGEPPATVEENLKNIAAQRLLFQTTIGVFALAIILVIPAVLALYLALKEVNKNRMLIATALVGVGIPLMLADFILLFPMVTLSNGYMAATSEAQRAAYVAAADLAQGVALAFEGLPTSF